jgi:hypothetical protein
VYVLALTSLIETAAATGKNLTGNILSFDDAFSLARLQALEDSFAGVFAYLAFFPVADAAVTEYVKSGTLASDSGPSVLVLFNLDQQARWPTALPESAFDSWLQVDAQEHPSYPIARALFAPKAAPPLPLLVLFDSWTREANVVAVGLSDLSTATEARERMRTVFSIVQTATAKGPATGKTMDDIARKLAARRIEYDRSAGLSVRERLWKVSHFVGDHLSDLVAVVGLVA